MKGRSPNIKNLNKMFYLETMPNFGALTAWCTIYQVFAESTYFRDKDQWRFIWSKESILLMSFLAEVVALHVVLMVINFLMTPWIVSSWSCSTYVFHVFNWNCSTWIAKQRTKIQIWLKSQMAGWFIYISKIWNPSQC